jgi:hypothetical protein
MIAGAALAPKPRHAALEHAARQELPELALDELREAHPIPSRRRSQEGLQVLGNDLMEHCMLRVAGPVDRWEGHAPTWGQGADRDNARERYT